MIIIAEKINGAIPSTSKAIDERDEEFIRNLARKQDEYGATFIDCCASRNVGELELQEWLIGLIQEESDLPIAIDSPDPQVCIDAMKFCNRPGLINSVSGEGNKMDIVFPVIADTKWGVVALLSDVNGIPSDVDGRMKVFHDIMAKAKEYNIAPNRIYIDPHNAHKARMKLHYADLTDASSLCRWLDTIAPDEVYNLAAQSHVAVSFEIPDYTVDVIATGALRLLEAVRSHIAATGRSHVKFY